MKEVSIVKLQPQIIDISVNQMFIKIYFFYDKSIPLKIYFIKNY